MFHPRSNLSSQPHNKEAILCFCDKHLLLVVLFAVMDNGFLE